MRFLADAGLSPETRRRCGSHHAFDGHGIECIRCNSSGAELSDLRLFADERAIATT